MRIYEAGRRFSSIIEATADTIAARSPDPTIRHNALNWKIAAIPLIEEASLRPDAVVAAVDLWGFSMQLADYVELVTGGTRSATCSRSPSRPRTRWNA